MLTKLFEAPIEEDICPNCGTACLATDVFCPNCRGNLDELYEQLPDLKESHNVFRLAYKIFPFLTWLTPLILILSPLIVSLVRALPSAHNLPTILDRSPLQIFLIDVSHSILVPSGFLLISAIPLFLCTTRPVRAKLGPRWVVILAALFSILSVITLRPVLQITYLLTAAHMLSYLPGLFLIGYADWVNLVWIDITLVVVLNLMTIIGKEKTA
jgi:hypothetical protein